MLSFFALLLVIIIIVLDLKTNRIFVNKWIVGIILIIIPHYVLYYDWIFSNTFGLYKIISLIALSILLLYFNWRIHIKPSRVDDKVSFKVKLLVDAQVLIIYGFYLVLVQSFYFLFFYQESVISNLDLIVTVAYVVLIFANAYWRVFLLSSRLRIIRRLILMFLAWVPIINIFAFIYLYRVVGTEFAHELYRLDNQNNRIESDCCATKYPLLMLHGVGFRDLRYLNYWGRIPKHLERNGAQIYYGHQEGWASVENNGSDIAKVINEICDNNGVSKVNIIAHSKGGLDARYLISTLGMGDKVASLTTIQTPHYGCNILSHPILLNDGLLNFIGKFVNAYFKKLGDKDPQFVESVKELRTDFVEQFNKDNLDDERVYYQSYMSVMNHPYSDFILCLPNFLIKLTDEENDGLVTVSSSKWGEVNELILSTSKRGISHGDMIDLVREDYEGFDVIETYIEIVSKLKNRGF